MAREPAFDPKAAGPQDYADRQAVAAEERWDEHLVGEVPLVTASAEEKAGDEAEDEKEA